MRVVNTGKDTAVSESESADESVGTDVCVGVGDHDDTEDREVERKDDEVLLVESDNEVLRLVDEGCRLELDDGE